MIIEIPTWLLYLGGTVLVLAVGYMLFTVAAFAYVGRLFLKNWRPPNW